MTRSFLTLAALLLSGAAAAHPAFRQDSVAVIQSDTTVSDQTVYLLVDEPPVFGGGDVLVFRDWVLRHLEIDEALFREGGDVRMVVSFVVGKDGMPEEVEMIRSSDERLSGEVLRVISTAPPWTPGRVKGAAVRTKQVMPVNIRLQMPAAADSLAAEPQEDIPLAGDDALLVAERMPAFQDGGLNKFRNWVVQNVKYPMEALAKGVEEPIVVAFVIEKDGTLSRIEVLQGENAALIREVVRVLSSSPRWTPGQQKGQLVRVRFTFPLIFRLDKSRPAKVPRQDSRPATRLPSRRR